MTWYYPFIIIAIGALLGLIKLSRRILKILDYAGNIVLLSLMFTIGISVGADDTIIANVGIIGFQCLVISLCALFFSVLFVVLLEKTVLPLDKIKKKLIDENINAAGEVKIDSEQKRSPLVWIIPVSIILGVITGYLLIPQGALEIVNKCFFVSLTFLFITIGINLSQNKSVFQYIKKLGVKVILLPLAILLGSIVGGYSAVLLINVEPHISLMSASGMCYYSLTGAFMTQTYGIKAGTYGFLVNVLREFFTVLLLPLLIKIGKGAPLAAGGAADMDTLLAPISKFVGVELGFVSLLTGIFLSFCVPVILPVFVKIFGG